MEPLDNPVWHALTGPHATVAEGGDHARRYRPEYSVWSAVHDDADPAAWAELRSVVGRGGYALFAGRPDHPDDWVREHEFRVLQMVLDDPIDHPNQRDSEAAPAAQVRRLHRADTPAMTALARATEPGPWCERTAELGDFFGIQTDGRLLAMAGERLRLPSATEISGVCTDASARGRGWAATLVAAVARGIHARGARPFLHVRDTNENAIRLYERLGFRCRVIRGVSVLRANEAETGP